MNENLVLSWLPDEPWYVEARGMLLEGSGTVIWSSDDAAVVYAADDDLAGAVGRLHWTEIAKALDTLSGGVELVVAEGDTRVAGEWPLAWNAAPAIVHTEPDRRPPVRPDPSVRLLTGDDRERLHHVPAELRGEVEEALTYSPVMAVFDGDLPVSFCYAGWVTERWWDVSIDTLEPWQNRGYAGLAASALTDLMRHRGKRAIWGALETNMASLNVARRLGFEPVGRVFVMTRR